ncbi:PIN domain-containing protein [Alkalitalea saponilacus]|uniref:Predicted nucleic acid-binding protein, contains PIN domain n=1 Tax=Alkalitalea saponilacus TaxID=889453 RepID=A0A1T5HBT1_9BACT|nr:PIN domain-containing protein [Alkalitalea saponilacus]ASB50769.1 nuclease [Alkalitalea saponilacus]SKC18029.1 Predicted nucleic acid-binding protein, contains PIN domain [Alkalitalea saponilacus]
MIHSVRFRCVLDTNVIYPLWTRDLLLWFAYYELYTPKWSKNIFSEWIEVMKRKGISKDEAYKRAEVMNKAFPDALVKNYEPLIKGLVLPDEGDRHVLAAAIKTNADLIITNNLKDFPTDYLIDYGMKAKSPDEFLTDIIDLNQELSIAAFRKLVLNKKNPPYDEYDVLEIFRKNGLKDTADYLHALI